MSRVFGIIVGMNKGPSLVEFGCRVGEAGEGLKPVFDVAGEVLEMKQFWNREILSKACYEFWSHRLEQFKNPRITVYEESELNISPHNASNIHSLQLSVCMAPLLHYGAGELKIRYQNLCFSGTINGSGRLIVGIVSNCQEKYKLLMKQKDFVKPGEKAAFIYVANKDQEIKTKGSITAIRIEPGSPVTKVIWELSGKIPYSHDESNIFKAETSDAIRKMFLNTNSTIHCTWYLTTVFLAEQLFFFDLLRDLVKQKKMFNIEIFMPSAVLGIDIVRDNIPFKKPAWYEKMEKERPDKIIKINDDLRILHELIENEIFILQRLVFIYKDDPWRRPSIVCNEDKLQSELMDLKGDNALYITFGSNSEKKQYLVYTSEHGLGFSDMSDNNSKSLHKELKTLFKNTRITNEKEEFRLVLIGPPGIGKTSVSKILACPGKRLLSTDPFINDHIFNDKKVFLNEVWYTREDFEGRYADLSEDEKEKRDAQVIPIRELGVEAVLRMAIATGDFADLDGKAILSPKVQFFLRNHNFIVVLLIPKLNETEKHGKSPEEIKVEEFNEFFKIYRNNGKRLLDKSERRNICTVMDKASCRIYEDLRRSNKKRSVRCDKCTWYEHNKCEDKIEGEEMWQRFHEGLYEEIWALRYHYYHAAADICINVRDGMSLEKIASKIKKEVDVFKKMIITAPLENV